MGRGRIRFKREWGWDGGRKETKSRNKGRGRIKLSREGGEWELENRREG